MDSVKVVARFADGRIKKGYTWDFSPNKPMLHIIRGHGRKSAGREQVNLAELKAVFFVKTFTGNPNYVERKQFLEGDNPGGEKAEVTFEDGEALQGSVLRYKMQETGFFFFPADPNSNNLTLFVVNAAVKNFRYLRFHSITSPSRDDYQCLIPEGYGTLLMLSGEERELLKLILPKVLAANTAREYIVDNLGTSYLEVGQELLQEMERI
jgi:hypothetical protein